MLYKDLNLQNLTKLVLGFSEASIKISDYIYPFIDVVKGNKQKSVELCHVGKFLFLLNKGYKIESLSETPDFIITNNETRVGLEHEILVINKLKKTEGAVSGFFENAKKEFQNTYPNIKFLANIWYDRLSISIKKKEYDNKKYEVNKVIYHFYKTGELLPNSIITDIYITPHTKLTFSPNSGAHIVQQVKEQDIYFAIQKKEKKIESYIKKSNVKNQWLLIVVGGCEACEYDIPKTFNFQNFKCFSKFDKIFLLHDSEETLYTVKY